MGGALAIHAASAMPDLVERLVLIAPAGLPIDKPIRRSVRDFFSQVTRGDYPCGTAWSALAAVARAPRAAFALAQQVRALDLRRECARVRAAGIPTTVIGCVTDTLITTDRTRTLAEALGADYRELDVDGGHMWMLADRARLAAAVSD
jgi:pimeloyl-ACP methyl ester carboxylesterase